jgi:hypothetical protein
MRASAVVASLGLPLSSVLMLLNPRRAEGDGWTLTRQAGGIRSWRRELKGTSLVEFRARGTVEAPLFAVAAVIRAADRAAEWMESCNGAGILEWRSATRWISYNRTQSPAFFIRDRDVVLENTVELLPDRKALHITFRRVEHAAAPPVAGVVRIPELDGHWRLTAISAESTEVEYQVHTDPGGTLPRWLVNWASESLPAQTLQNLRREVGAAGFEKHREILRTALELEAPSS